MSSRILIVDDEEIVIRSCLRILSGNRYVVDSVQDGWDALRKIDETHGGNYSRQRRAPSRARQLRIS